MGSFLPQNPLEPDNKYQHRKSRACYRSYLNGIINQFASQLFGAPFAVRAMQAETREPIADLPIFYHQFKENCDGQGTDLADFARACFTEAQIKRMAWVIAHLPNGQDSRSQLTASEYAGAGLDQAWVSQVCPEDVYDWETDAEGRLLWVLVHSESRKRVSFDSVRGGLVTETWTVYDAAEIVTFQISYDPKKPPNAETQIPEVSRMAHGFAQVPVLCLELPVGLWLSELGAEAQIQHFRLSNDLNYAMSQVCFPVAIFKCDPDNTAPSIGRGDAVLLGENEDLEYKSPSADSFNVHSQEVANQQQEIHRLCRQMGLASETTGASVGRSADSKIQDAQATEIFLQTFASLVKEFIESLYALISAGRGEPYGWSVEGMDTFRVSSASDMVAVAQQVLQLGIPSKAFKRELYKHVTSVVLPDNLSQDMKDQILGEIDSAEIELTPLQSPGFAPPNTTSQGADSNGAVNQAKELPRPNGATVTNQQPKN